MTTYEYYCEKFIVTEWRDGSVYKTESQGYGWFSEDIVKKPPHGVIFAPPSSEKEIDFLTIRVKSE